MGDHKVTHTVVFQKSTFGGLPIAVRNVAIIVCDQAVVAIRPRCHRVDYPSMARWASRIILANMRKHYTFTCLDFAPYGFEGSSSTVRPFIGCNRCMLELSGIHFQPRFNAVGRHAAAQGQKRDWFQEPDHG